MQQRSIPMAIVLSLVTCGIYSLYWIVCLNDESKAFADDATGQSGGMVVLLSIVTCGIYLYYWYYIMGRRMMTVQEKCGLPVEDRSVVYIILAVLGLSIVADALIQNDLNNAIAKNN